MKPSKKQAELAKKILETEDKQIINYIQAIFDTNSACFEEEAPEYIKQSIERGLKDIEEGRVTPHEEVMKKYRKWLKK
jgi:predicted transcriptional regulator